MNDGSPGTIVVAGATGNVGRRVVRQWTRRGGRVVVLSREVERARVELDEFAGNLPIEPTPATIDNAQGLAGKLAGVRALIACTPTSVAVFGPLLELARVAGIERVVVLSSTRRYSRVRDESVGRVGRAEAFAKASPLGVTILRPTMIVGGPGDNNVARVVGFARRWGFVPMVGDGRALIQPVWAEDVAAAALAVLDHAITRGRDYTLAGPRGMTTRAFLAMVARCAGVGRVLPIPSWVAMMAAVAFDAVGKRAIAATLRRAMEDKAFDIGPAARDFGYAPRSLRRALTDR